ncbi:MAG: putative domain containing protein [Pedosphaera sp.]|nr:putative domain containing protein [Pedosphaera sp.]
MWGCFGQRCFYCFGKRMFRPWILAHTVSMKKGAKKILCASVIVAIFIFAGVQLLLPPARQEPVYQGKRLTHWLKQLDDGQAMGISSGSLPEFSPAQLEAANAIRAMGADALPLLMEDIHATPSQNDFHFKFQKWLNSLCERVTGSRPFFNDLTEKDRIRWRAAQGLAALGPLAKPAVPELTRLLYTNYFHSSIKEAAYALATVGPEGIDVLTNAVQPKTEWSGMCAIWALGQHPAAGTNAIPFLIGATSSASEGTACGSIQVLGLFHTDGEHVIPALAKALSSPKPSVRRDAARALGQFGAQAISIQPLLESLTNDPAVKDEANRALEKIQPAKK